MCGMGLHRSYTDSIVSSGAVTLTPCPISHGLLGLLLFILTRCFGIHRVSPIRREAIRRRQERHDWKKPSSRRDN